MKLHLQEPEMMYVGITMYIPIGITATMVSLGKWPLWIGFASPIITGVISLAVLATVKLWLHGASLRNAMSWRHNLWMRIAVFGVALFLTLLIIHQLLWLQQAISSDTIGWVEALFILIVIGCLMMLVVVSKQRQTVSQTSNDGASYPMPPPTYGPGLSPETTRQTYI